MDAGGTARKMEFRDGEVEEVGSVSLNSIPLQELFDYWSNRLTRQHLPSRQQIDPVDIPHLLSILSLVDVEEHPRRFRYRLMGTRVVDWFRRDFTGCYLGDSGTASQDDELLRRGYNTVVDTRAPLVDVNCTPHLDRPYRQYEQLVLPLENHDDRRVNMLLVGMTQLP